MLKIEQFVCNAFQENTYVVWDEETHKCAIIDPGMSTSLEWSKVRDYISSLELSVEYVLLTHAHVDHLMGTGFCVNEYGVDVYGSLSEQSHLPAPQKQANMFGVELKTQPAAINKNISDAESLHLGNIEIQVIDCPGHSFAGLCYYFVGEGVLFTGDVLFCNSVGRSDFGSHMGCNGPMLAEGIVKKLLILPAETHVFPGHGPMTTIDYEMKYNPYF